MVQSFLDAEIGKDRLNDGQTPGIDLPALGSVDLGFHLFDQIGMRTLDLDGQKPARGCWLAQTFRSHRTSRTIPLVGAINIINPVAVALAASTAFQDLALRTDIDLSGNIEDKVCIRELRFWFRRSRSAMDAILEPLLFEEAGISLAKLQVRDVSIQLFPLAESQIGKAVIVAVGGELFALKVAWLLANGLHILLATLQHGRQIVVVLAIERFSVDDDLVFAIHQRLGVVALDHPMGGGHLRGLVVGDIALDLVPAFPDLGFFFLEKLIQAFHLLQQALFLVLRFVCVRIRHLVLADVFVNDLLEFCLELVPFFLQFLEGPAPFLGRGGRQLHPIQAEVRASQQMEFFTDQQDVGEQALDLLLHGRDKMRQGAVIWMTATAECHEEHILTTSTLDLARTDDPSGVRKQDHLE